MSACTKYDHSKAAGVALPNKFTIPNDKQLVIELTEKDGGRNQTEGLPRTQVQPEKPV